METRVLRVSLKEWHLTWCFETGGSGKCLSSPLFSVNPRVPWAFPGRFLKIRPAGAWVEEELSNVVKCG